MEKTNSKKKTTIGICLFVIIFGALLTTATFYDLKISHILVRVHEGEYYTYNPFGALFETIGCSPMCISLACAIAIIYSNIKRCSNKFIKTYGTIVANIATTVPMIILMFDTQNYITRFADEKVGAALNSLVADIALVLVGIAFGELLCYWFGKLDDDKARSLLRLSFIIIFTVIFANGIVNIIKNFMCRPRYRTMKCLNQPDENGNIYWNFHRWYQKFTMPEEGNPLYLAEINGHKIGHDGYRSFPSGHTSEAGSVYTLLALPRLLKKYNTPKMKALLYFFAVTFTGLVAVSRIVCGAHFFSDVLVGGTLSFVSAMVGIKIFIRKDYERI